ncbi:MAG TPA: glycoside hydrolase family 2 protein [Opitutaceae bacterium]|nr:glycoside hydrolase family 2 protein [Opitutaceae bacterium]
MPSFSLSTAKWRVRDCSDKKWFPATVPGCVHTDLLAAGKIPDPFWADNEAKLQWIEERDWEYETSFSLGVDILSEEIVELVADGLDTVATVFLNGTEIARTENMFVGFRWNVRDQLRRGRNELRIRFESAMKYIRSHRTGHQPRELNDPVGRCTVIRKQQCQFGWDWGPRFVTAGIWRDLRIEAWSGNRLESVRIQQDHTKPGRVTLTLAPELARRDAKAVCRWRLKFGDDEVGSGEGVTIEIAKPQLWWPHGQGAQSLYELEVEVVNRHGKTIGVWKRRIGLRTIVLDQHPDEWGTTFQFLINGRPVFIKGANWIPAHSFVTTLKREDYARDLRGAVDAHMNMIRVWGGGIYESEDFYDLCDELGLLVWQDYMFACTLYPADKAFLDSVKEEVAYQTRRLRHRACVALWCGNNEVYSCNAHELSDPKKKKLYAEYEALFHRAIPAAVAATDSVTPFWPSSPWRGDTAADHASGEKRGDTHYWDVWHSRYPVKEYERWDLRFVSEFGMQSYASPETQQTFCPPNDTNVFGAAMENHQKNRGGNQVILDYVSRRYRFPKDQESLIYLSQLNQAYCMQVGVEHYRRLMPHCMGAMYWQLNDCWPVASWSSIEFTGKWKALQYIARRFYAPSIVTAHVPGDETAGIGNYRGSTISDVHLYTVHDEPATRTGVLHWDVFHIHGKRLLTGAKKVKLQYGRSVKQQTLSLEKLMREHHRDNLYLRIALEVDGRKVSEDSVFLTLPRFVHLEKRQVKTAIEVAGKRARITFTSPVFAHRFAFELPGLPHTCGDNFFDLYPGEAKTIEVDFAAETTTAEVQKRLTWMSLADTY